MEFAVEGSAMARPDGPYKPEESSGDVAMAFAPQYHVILHDDDSHTYHYVIAMLVQLFGKSHEDAYQHAREVDTSGVTIVETTTLERAELKRDQIQAFGADPMLENSRGSMCATIEPAE